MQTQAVQHDYVPASVPLLGDGATWDGQHLWELTAVKAGSDKMQLHLARIDVGLARKPDTTARHNQALAFERKNGTLKAIPLFEELIAYDPAAAEVRNHVAWALGTRPQEPYHDIQRAKQLVESALDWQPWNPELWDTLAEIYWRLGDAKLAEHLEAKAINLNPNKTFYWRQLDKFRTQLGTDKAPEPAY
jgi:tetratricopeptide (TPR) repeat protein